MQHPKEILRVLVFEAARSPARHEASRDNYRMRGSSFFIVPAPFSGLGTRISLTGDRLALKMERPKAPYLPNDLNDRPDYIALPHCRKTRGRRHGRGVQGRGHPAAPLCRTQIFAR